MFNFMMDVAGHWLLISLFFGGSWNKLCRDHAGKEFVITYVPLSITNEQFLQIHLYSAHNQPVNTVLETPLLTDSNKVSTAFTVPEDKAVVVNIRNLPPLPENVKSNRVFLVTASQDIMVYASSGKPKSSATYLIFPTNFLGVEYVIMTYPPTVSNGDKSVASVIAVYDNTTLTIRLSSNVGIEISVAGVPYRSSESFTFSLLKYETFLLSSDVDLTGTYIIGTKPFAVLSGNNDVEISPGSGQFDHILEQLPPVHTYGREFIVTAYPPQQSSDIVIVTTLYNDTELIIDVDSDPTFTHTVSQSTTSFNASFRSYLRLQSSLPVLLGHFGRQTLIDGGFNASVAMSIVQPVSSYYNKYTVTVPVHNITTDYKHYVVLIMNQSQISNTNIDGKENLASYKWNSINGTDYMFQNFTAAENSIHTLQNDNGTFGGYLYGYAGYQSYAAPIAVIFDEQKWQRNGDIYKSSLQLITRDKLPFQEPVQEFKTKSPLDCHRRCLDDVKCGVIGLIKMQKYTICKVYGYEERCEPYMTANGYRMYARKTT